MWQQDGPLQRQVQLKKHCKFIQISGQDLGVIPLAADTLLTEAADLVFWVTRKHVNPLLCKFILEPLEAISVNNLQPLLVSGG